MSKQKHTADINLTQLMESIAISSTANVQYYIGDDGHIAARTIPPEDFYASSEELIKRARLYNAAPDLLEALKAMVAQEVGDKPITEAEIMALAAIKRAEGE
jgi:hypothetical protein